MSLIKVYDNGNEIIREKAGERMVRVESEQSSVEKKKWIIHGLSLLGFVLAVIFFIYGIRTGIFKSQEAMAAFLEPFGLLTPVLYIIFIAFQSTFMVVPGALGNLVGVLLFGPFWGIAANYIGTILGSSANFGLARYYGPDIIRVFSSEKGFRRYKKWLKGDEKKFHKWFAIFIFLPLAPDDLLCYMAGLTSMTYRKFLLIIVLGKPLAVTAYSLLLHYGFTNLVNCMGW